MGDIDLVRALGLAGVSSVFFGPSDASARFSRHVAATVRGPTTGTPRTGSSPRCSTLAAIPARAAGPLHADRRDAAARLAPSRGAGRGLPLRARRRASSSRSSSTRPASRRSPSATGCPCRARPRARRSRGSAAPALDLAFPLIVKPLTRAGDVGPRRRRAKAMRVGDAGRVGAVWPALADAGTEFLVQELVPGPETAIESYHAYVDAEGEVAGEFTGRKIRTFPPRYGYSTARRDHRAARRRRLGRDVARPAGAARRRQGRLQARPRRARCTCSRSTRASRSGTTPRRSPGSTSRRSSMPT